MFSSIDSIWVMIRAALVFFMQAGFAMLETGFTRAKNAGNIIMKNFMDLCIGALCFWAVGFGLMHGKSINGLVGMPDLFATGNYSTTIPSVNYIVWQMFFCATAATIVSGAMAERTAFRAYVIYSAIISTVIYPVIGSWIWNTGGFLAQAGYHDYAGGTVVHLVGGITGLAGAKVLGPRIGKYHKGKSKAIPGHSLPLVAIGVFILWIGWYGFNGGSVLGATGDDTLITIGNVFLNTTLSAAASAVTAMFLTWKRYGKSDITMTLNGVVAGLVAITAGADVMSSYAAVIVGVLAAFTMVFGVEFIDHILKVDDPVGAVAVHGFCGALGSIAVGFFHKTDGVFSSGKFHLLGIQTLGVLLVATVVFFVMGLVFLAIKHTVGIRVSKEDEIKGLDKSEHGIAGSYMDFVSAPYDEMVSDAEESNAVSVIDEDTVLDASAYVADGIIRKVVVVMNPSRFEALKEALDEIEITGMTVTQVSGCGIQKGNTEYYRGAENSSHLLAKVKVEIVISTVPLALVIDTIKRILHTGKIGDGKIFVYEVNRVIKIRTNEEGNMALE